MKKIILALALVATLSLPVLTSCGGGWKDEPCDMCGNTPSKSYEDGMYCESCIELAEQLEEAAKQLEGLLG